MNTSRKPPLVWPALLTASLIVTATVHPVFGQSSKITQTEVRLGPVGPEAIAHDQSAPWLPQAPTETR